MSDELKKRILDEVTSAGKCVLSRPQLRARLNLETSEEDAELERTLDEMEENLEIFRGSRNGYMTPEQAGVVIGRISINRKGVGYVDRENAPSIVINPSRLNGALDGDTVMTKPSDYSYGDAYNGSVLRVVKRAKNTLVGTYINTPYGVKFWPDDEKFRGYRVNLIEPEKFTAIAGMKAVARIDKYDNPLELTLIRVIGYKDDPGMDLLSILLEHGIDLEYPDAVNEQAEAMPQTVSEEEKEGRTDLTNDLTITIDGDDSKDFDDAVAVEKIEDGWILKVSIADVTHYVTENSPLDEEARKRGTSSYVIDKVVGMLPHLLSNGICSLNPHEVRLTNTCEMKIDRGGHIVEYSVYPSFIRSAERMTYNNVNKILDGDQELCGKYAHLVEMLNNLADCADAIREKRVAGGAIDFETEESVFTLDEKGKPIDVRPAERGHGERIIEDCMIAANVSVANLMHQNDFPCVYRIHAEPSEKKLTNFSRIAYMLGHPAPFKVGVTPKDIQDYLATIIDTDEYPVISFQMLRSMSKAVYDPKCRGHFGLAESEYLHFTSPIRRYPDLLVHRMLRRYYYEEDFTRREYDEAHMREYAELSSERERAADEAEYQCEDMKKAEYMSAHIGEKFEGLITSVKNFGFYVTLPNTVEGLVRVESLYDGYYRYDEGRMALINEKTHMSYRAGDSITVQVVSASKEARSVEFGVIREGGNGRRQELPAAARQSSGKHKTRSRSARKAEMYGYDTAGKKGKGRKNGRRKK